MRRLLVIVAALIVVCVPFAASAVPTSPSTMYVCTNAAGRVEGAAYMNVGTPPKCGASYPDVWAQSGWTLISPTTTTTTSTTTSTTTIPPTTTTTTVAPSALNLNRPFSANSPWNTPTPAGTQWFDTPVLHIRPSVTSGDNVRHLWIQAGWNPYFAAASDPVWTFQMPAYVAADWHRDRPAQTIPMRAPDTITASPDSDGVLTVVEPDGDYIEVWQAHVDLPTRTVTSNPGPGWATGNAITGTGTGTLTGGPDGYGLNAGTRAANYSAGLGGRLTLDEITGTAPIDHALEVTLPYDMLKGGWPSPGVNYVPPATADDSGGWNGPIKMGSRIGIPAGVPMPAGLSPLGIKFWTALQTYGMFVGDFGGGNWPILQMDGTDNTPACTIFCFWNNYHGQGVSDWELILPSLRVADYQP
jgi:hypothetical protein